jgi:hypothetical protein
MIVGDPRIFAIESEITAAYERINFRALGYFMIHIGGRQFGVYKPDATMLACSYGEVGNRLAARGKHTALFAAEQTAGDIAHAFRNARYSDEQKASYFGIPLDKDRRSNKCQKLHLAAVGLLWQTHSG